MLSGSANLKESCPGLAKVSLCSLVKVLSGIHPLVGLG